MSNSSILVLGARPTLGHPLIEHTVHPYRAIGHARSWRRHRRRELAQRWLRLMS
ncbi:MAG TPA: hypothetical protein VFX15_13485 [Actinomycetes bacterium]|nr:hypothetical protein [Actinomycetes bacterium]